MFTLAETCSAAADTAFACADVSSADAPICVLVTDSSSDEEASVHADSRIRRTTVERSPTALLKDAPSWDTSSEPVTRTSLVRSAWASDSSPTTQSASGFVMPRETSRAA